MNDDVLPSLLKEVQAKFEAEFGKSKVVEDAFKKLKAKKATYSTANNFAIEVGEILARALQSVVTADRLPDGKMYYNIAKRLLEPVLGNNYKTVADYAVKVQSDLNKKAKIGLNVKKPVLNQDRIDGLINRLSSEDDFNKVKWILDEPVVNFTQAVIDDTIKINAELQYSAGLNPTIERRTFGQCCRWCESLSGTYNYPHVPKDFYHRHQRCRCTIEYDPKNGKKQNSWSKKWYRSDSSELERRRKMNIDIQDNNRKSDILEYRKIVDVLGVEKSPISLAEFQDLKYNDVEKYEKLVDKTFIQNKFNTGEWLDKVNPEKQARHIQSTAEKGKSYFFDDVDVEALYDKYKMTGTIRKLRSGAKSSDEKIDLFEGRLVGIDIFTGKPVNAMTIKYSKTGAHLIPTYYERGN